MHSCTSSLFSGLCALLQRTVPQLLPCHAINRSAGHPLVVRGLLAENVTVCL